MARRRNTSAAQAPLASAFSTMMQSASGASGVVVTSAADAYRTTLGIPLPHLCLAWLIGSNIWPLQRAFELHGKPHAGKSALGFELASWFLLNGGNALIIDAERKLSPGLLQSLVTRLIPTAGDRAVFAQTSNIDEVFSLVTECIKLYKQDEALSRAPMLMLIDPIAGSGMAASVDKTVHDGALGGGYGPAKRASMLTEFMSVIPTMLQSIPLSLGWTAHLKKAMATMPGRPPADHVPGGSALEFASSLRLKLKREGKCDGMYRGVRIKFESVKSCFGGYGRSIEAELRWYNIDCGGRYEQITTFDWPKATFALLKKFIGVARVSATQGTDAATGRDIKDLLGLEIRPGGVRMSQLSSDWLSYTEASNLLEKADDVLPTLYGIMGIDTNYTTYITGSTVADTVAAPPLLLPSARPYKYVVSDDLVPLPDDGGSEDFDDEIVEDDEGDGE